MTRTRTILTMLAVAVLFPAISYAQPSRQMPGTRPYLPGSPTNFPAALNPRTQVVSNVGTQSTDFYGKKGYPSQLGDSSTASTTGGTTGTTGTTGGNTGVQSSGSGGFQGNSGNQIGQNGGGTILGGLFGGSKFQTGGNNFGNVDPATSGITGGAFSGMTPKGFGFGGTPEYSASWTGR